MSHSGNSIKPIVRYKRSRFGKYALYYLVVLALSISSDIMLPNLLILTFVWLMDSVHGMLLHMMWTTPAFTLRPRHLHVLQSYFHHHPDWELRLYVTDTIWTHWGIMLRPFYEAGYSIKLVTIDREFLAFAAQKSEEATAWLENHEKWKTGSYYYSHLTDLLRFALLYRDGGVYSDFDALLLKPMSVQEWLVGPSTGRTVIGRDRVPETCDWCLTGGMYLAPGVMIAERGSHLLKKALEIGFGDSYDPTVFNHAGPRAVTMASKQVPRDSVIQLPSEVFYPVNYKEAVQLFKAVPEGMSASEMLERIKRRATSLHFFGAQTKNVSVEKGSIMDILQDESTDYYVTNGAPIHLDIRTNFKSTVQLKIDFGTITPSNCSGDSVAEINHCLSTVIVTPDPLFGISKVEVEMNGTTTTMSIYNLSALLTVTVKTMDRMHKVFELVSSLSQHYPNLPILVANDGAQAFDTPAGPKRGFTYLPLPFDTGLSEARNIMVGKVETPLMMILDDDFVFTKDSDLGYLVHQLISNKLDIVAASSPADRDKHGLDYVGLLEKRNNQVHLIHGDRGGIPGSTCVRVDLVPNIFVARRVVLEKIRWDSVLKLGEHEDFFLRAMAADVKVANCRSVELTHRQDPHWLNKTLYDRMRSRVWEFLKMALQKHSLNTLTVFGMTTMAIQVEFEWDSKINYHLYQIDVFDITETTDDNQPGSFTFSHYVEPSTSCPISPKYTLITGLDPERYYRLLVRPGNHTMVHPSGPELLIRTPSYYDERNLVLNGNFYLNDDYWERSLGTNAALVALRPADSLPSEVAIPARKAQHTESLHPEDYAISIYIGAGPDTSVGRGIYQTIPVEELPSECLTQACQISVSAWTRVDRLFGPPAQLSLQLRLRHVWTDRVQDFHANWDPYEETRWQPMAFSTGLNISASKSSLVALEVWAWLVAPRGAAFFDDFYLSARPISDNGYL